MALKYAVKKTVFGFDETKTERYVARSVSMGTVDFDELCEEVTLVGMAPRGVVKLVLAGMIDAMMLNMKNGMSVKLGELGTIRPTFGCYSQVSPDQVDTSKLRRRKFVFTPGKKLKEMIKDVSIQRYTTIEQEDTSGGSNSNTDGGGTNPTPGGDDGNFE